MLTKHRANTVGRWSAQYDNEISSIFARAGQSRNAASLIDLFAKSRQAVRVAGKLGEWRMTLWYINFTNGVSQLGASCMKTDNKGKKA